MTSWGMGGKTVAGAGHQLLTLTCLEPKLRQSLKHSGSAQNSAAAFLEEHELASPSCCQLHSKAVLAPCPERGREGDMGKTANHQGLVSARHRPVLAEPNTYLLFTVTALSTRVITAWLKIYTCGTEFQAGSHVADGKVRTESPPKLRDAFCSQIYPIRPGFL